MPSPERPLVGGGGQRSVHAPCMASAQHASGCPVGQPHLQGYLYVASQVGLLNIQYRRETGVAPLLTACRMLRSPAWTKSRCCAVLAGLIAIMRSAEQCGSRSLHGAGVMRHMQQTWHALHRPRSGAAACSC